MVLPASPQCGLQAALGGDQGGAGGDALAGSVRSASNGGAALLEGDVFSGLLMIRVVVVVVVVVVGAIHDL